MSEPKNQDQVHSEDKKEGPTFQEILVPISKERKRILSISFAVSLLTLGINFLLPVYYKSTATLLPETQKDKLSALAQFSDIAQLAGVSVPGSEIARLYPTIVTSETILRNVIERKYNSTKFRDSVNLMEYFEHTEHTPDENMAKTLSTLRGLMSVAHDTKTSVVTLTMEMPEPDLAANVMNSVIAELDAFMRSKRVTNAGEQVKWIDVRTKEVENEMKRAEERLKDFRERNRQVGGSPQLMLEQERLSRDVQVKATVFIELKKQYELAKLEEIKNISIVNVLDPARPAVKKERPKRATNAAIMFILTFLFIAGYFVTNSLYREKILSFFAFLKGA